MKFDKKMLKLYAIAGGGSTYELCEKLRDALRGGVTMVQLREKNLSEEEYMARAVLVKALCREFGVPLIINDNVNVAVKSGADGVHVGAEDEAVSVIRSRPDIPKDFIVGATAKTPEQALKAQAEGASYLGSGAVFPSPTKQNAIGITFSQLDEICASVKIPVVAIGGIDIDNIAKLAGSKISGVAVASAIFSDQNPRLAAKLLRAAVDEIVTPTKTALTVAGSDSSGGAGIQADIKTMTANGVFAMSAITAMTAQNTTGVTSIQNSTPEFLRDQLDAVFTDIFPDAVKIGMVSTSELILVIADRLRFYGAKNVVVDPVMVATAGSSLIKTDAVTTLVKELLPLATIVTPNIPEAEILSGFVIKKPSDMEEAAKFIYDNYGCAVLLKGGHAVNDASDYLYCGGGHGKEGQGTWFYGKRINNKNTHGTGCTLSSAIASNLAKGYTLEMSISLAKEYLSGALAAGLDLGKGRGPMKHWY